MTYRGVTALRRLAGLGVCLLAVAGCGLSPGAVDAIKNSGGRVVAGGSGAPTSGGGAASSGTAAGAAAGGGSAAVGGSGSVTGAGGSTGLPASGPSGAPSGAGGGGGAAPAGGGGGAAAGGSGATPNAPYETIGITAATIRLGLHAPQTGAAPVPLQAFATGSKLFWENHTLFGRKVVVDFQDDQYNPSVARSVCEQLSRQDFLVIGGAGTDQIQACATDPVLTSTHTPYLSAGVTTNGLNNLPYYFAFTRTYAAQAPAVFQMTSSLYPTQAKGKWAVITEATPNFNDVTTAAAQVLSAHHIGFTTIRTPKVFQQSDADSAVAKAKQYGATVIFLDVDPNFWIDLIRSSSQQLFTPAWVGPGITNGENLVAGPVCGEQPTLNAAFLSPYFGLDRQPPGFTNETNPAPDTAPQERDLEMDVYGANEAVYYMLSSVGSIQNLTRDKFIAAMAHFTAAFGRQLDVYPTISFNGGHFGGTGMWQLKLNCQSLEYTTVGSAPIS
jgi:branched-chain amino acid transport system substrate-binding protein